MAATGKQVPGRRVYPICTHSRDYRATLVVTSDSIIAEFQARGLEVPASLIELSIHGPSYSYEEHDILSAAMSQLNHPAGQAGVDYRALWERLGREVA